MERPLFLFELRNLSLSLSLRTAWWPGLSKPLRLATLVAKTSWAVYMRACVAWNLASASDAQVKLQRVQTRSLTSPSNMSPGSDAPTDKCSAKAAHGTTAEAGSYEIPQAAQAFALLIATARLAACPSSSRCRGRTSQVLLDSGRFDGIICSLDEFRGCRH